MIVGFTGTRNGMTSAQKIVVPTLLLSLWRKKAWFHHGDCVGADEEAFHMAKEANFWTHSHPATNGLRAYTKSDRISESLTTLDRNHVIVDVSDVMVATPHESKEVLRSGTWATVRYATKAHTPIHIVLPNGEIEVRVNG